MNLLSIFFLGENVLVLKYKNKEKYSCFTGRNIDASDALDMKMTWERNIHYFNHKQVDTETEQHRMNANPVY